MCSILLFIKHYLWTEDTTCRDMIWENVWNVVAFIIGDLFKNKIKIF